MYRISSPPRRLTEEEREVRDERIREEYRAGLTLREIADGNQVKEARVSQIARAAGIPHRKLPREYYEERTRQIVELLRTSGLTYEEIGDRFDMRQEHVYLIRVRAGLPARQETPTRVSEEPVAQSHPVRVRASFRL